MHDAAGEPRSAAYAKYLHAPDQSQHVTIEEAEALGRDLAGAVRAAGLAPDLVVGLANGAFLPATVTAEALGAPLRMVKVRRRGTRYKQRLLAVKRRLRIPSALIMAGPLRALWVLFQKRTSTLEAGAESFDFDVAGKRVLMVDDCVETGASFRYVAERLAAAGAAEVRTAVYCWAHAPGADEAQTRPDVHLHRQIQFYPWSNNSRHLDAFYAWMSRRGLALWE